MNEVPAVSQLLENLRKRSGLSVRAMARRANFNSTNSYVHYEKHFKKELLPLWVARKLADALDGMGDPPIFRDEVLRLAGMPAAFDSREPGDQMLINALFETDGRARKRQPSVLPKDLPVYGTASAGPDGAFLLNSGETVDFAPRPPALMHTESAFAVYVEGDSMSPWREPGQLIHVNPRRPPNPGNHVIVEYIDPKKSNNKLAIVKKLIRRTASVVELEQYNPKAILHIQADTVVNIFRVIDGDDLLKI